MFVHPQLDAVDSVVRILGWPTLLGVLAWAIRTYDKGTRELKDLTANTAETRRMVMETHGAVTEIKTNHLTHLAEEIQSQTPILVSMDKTLAVIATKLDQPRS